MDRHCINGSKKNFQNQEICQTQTNKNDREAQFQRGLSYLNKQDFKAAERWFRYAANQGHHKASQHLICGIREGYFKSLSQHVNALVIEMLEKFITPFPSEPQIVELEEIVTYHLNTEYGLKKTSSKKKSFMNFEILQSPIR